MIVRRAFLRGLSGLIAASYFETARAESGPRLDFDYGWDPVIAGPTEADFHVALNGKDTANGTTAHPLRTIQRGVDLLAKRGSGSLAIHAGIYREDINLDALRGTAESPYRIYRYGRDRVTITAAEIIPDWKPCPAKEAQAIGLPEEVSIVARIPKQKIKHGSNDALNLYENGKRCPIAIDRADTSDSKASGDETTYYSAIFSVDHNKHIIAIRDQRLKNVPAGWIAGVKVLLYHQPNRVSEIDISEFDSQRGEIKLGRNSNKIQRSGKSDVMLYALRGAPWALKEGSWIARETDDETVSVYYVPRDPSALERSIEMSLRPTCIDFGGARHVELFGIEAIRAAGADRKSGICIRRNGMDDDPEAGRGLRLTHCRVGETLSVGPRGYGALFLRDAPDLTLRNVSVENVQGGFGLFLASCADADARFLHITNVSNAPARFYTLRRAVLAFSLFEHSARDAHANKFNFYEGCDTVLVYGVRCRDVGGYATYQEASRINFAFCDLPCDPKAHGRALVSQNRAPGKKQGGADGSGDPVAGTTFYYWNNTLEAAPAQSNKANALQLGPNTSSQRHAFFNMILNGGGLSDIYTGNANPKREQRSHNRYTGLSFWQSAKYGWRLGTAEEVMRPNGQVSGNGRDMRDLIQAEIAPLFPEFTDWNVDIDGQLINWARAPIGAQVRRKI